MRNSRKSPINLDIKMSKHASRFKNTPEMRFVAYGLIILVFTAVLTVFLYSATPPQIPLFYGHPTGESQLAVKSDIIIVFAIAVFVIILNSILIVLSESDFLKKTLSAGTAVVVFILCLSLVRILWLVSI